MKFKKLKKICLGLLASAGAISPSGVAKAHGDNLVNNVVQKVKSAKVEKDGLELATPNDLSKNNNSENSSSIPNKEVDLDAPPAPSGEVQDLAAAPTPKQMLPIEYIPKEKVEVYDLDYRFGEEKGFETERLSIEPLDKESLINIINLYDNSVYHYMSTESREGVPLNLRMILSSINPIEPVGGRSVVLVIKEKASKQPVGLITASVYRGGIAKYSYWLGKEFRGKGYAQETMLEFNRRMFANENINTVGIRAYDDNQPSLKLKDKMFKDLQSLYPNNLLREHTKKEPGINITHHYVSKFNFDPYTEISFVGENVKLDRVSYDDLVYMLKYLLSEESASKLPENVKNNLKTKLENLESGKLNLDNSSYIYVVSEFDPVTRKLVKPNGFIRMNAVNMNEKNSVFELSYIDDQGVEGVNELSSKSYFLLAKKILCGTQEQKLKIKLPEAPNEISKELTELLEKDPSNKILKIRVEKDAAGAETSLYIEKKNSNSNDANSVPAPIETDAAGQKLYVAEKSTSSDNAVTSNRTTGN